MPATAKTEPVMMSTTAHPSSHGESAANDTTSATANARMPKPSSEGGMERATTTPVSGTNWADARSAQHETTSAQTRAAHNDARDREALMPLTLSLQTRAAC